MREIVTDRLILTNFRENDWKALQEIVVSYKASPFSAYDHEWPTSDEQIQGVAKWFSEGDTFLAVRLKKEGKLVGFISLSQTDNKETLEFDIGYVFNSAFHKNGYAREGCRAMLSFAFRHLNAGRVVTGTASENTPSCHLLEKIGMKRISQGLCSFNKTSDGRPIEFLGYSFAIAKDEWAKQDEDTNAQTRSSRA